MITLEHKEAMQRNTEASMKCLQNKAYPYSLIYSGGPPIFRDEAKSFPGGNPIDSDSSLSSDSLEHSKEFHKKPTYQHELRQWSPFHPGANNVQRSHLNGFDSQFYPFPVDNRFQYPSFNMCPQSYPPEYNFQEFQYFVVIDFEATCDMGRNPHPQEIIEFPSVLVSSITGQVEGYFQTYVRPTCNKLLSDFCKDLTGIQQNQVDQGLTLNEALFQHDQWLQKRGIKGTNFAVVTWSNWDCRVMLESECRFKKIQKPPYFNQWINLKVPFRQVFGGERFNLKEAVEMAGLVWEGRPHCGLDDARNTAHLLTTLMRRGFKLSITNSLMYHSTDQSLTWKQSPECPSFSLYSPHRPKDFHFIQPRFHPCCYCGVKSSKGMIQKPGPKQGSFFFGCGNWTSARGARCQYFEWLSL